MKTFAPVPTPPRAILGVSLKILDRSLVTLLLHFLLCLYRDYLNTVPGESLRPAGGGSGASPLAGPVHCCLRAARPPPGQPEKHHKGALLRTRGDLPNFLRLLVDVQSIAALALQLLAGSLHSGPTWAHYFEFPE